MAEVSGSSLSISGIVMWPWIGTVLLFTCVVHCATQKACEIFLHSESSDLSVI